MADALRLFGLRAIVTNAVGGIGEAMGGWRAIVGDPDRPPSRMGVSIGDSLAATYGCMGALAALHALERTGKGQVVDSALYEAVLLFRLGALADRIEAAVDEANGCEEKIRGYIETFGAFLAEYRCFAAILAHEFADDGDHMSDRAAAELSRTLGIVTDILNRGIEEEIFSMENPMVVQMMIVSTLIMHQTTRTIRKRVASHVQGRYVVSPEPGLEDLARILANKIIKAIKKESL